MPSKSRLLLETLRRNLRFTQYDVDTVLLPLEHPVTLAEAALEQKATIEKDDHLAGKGKGAAKVKAGNTTIAAVKAGHEPRLKGIDADLLQARAALIPQTPRPDPRRVELMSSLLLKHTPQDINVLYGSASEDERRVMEAASAFVGRVPLKSANGLEWKPLLDPDMVNEGILARAAEANPAAAAKVRELEEIRGLHVTFTSNVIAEIREALSEYKLDPGV